jgi:fructan beta-fructosidase
MKLTLDKTYLNFPVTTEAPMHRMKVTVDGAIIDEFDIELADGGEPTFWAFMNVSEFAGKEATVEVEPANDAILAMLCTSDDLLAADDLYEEKERPQFHFSSRRGWLNDPNGLVFYDGEYHLYYQHNPYGWNWGNMNWGHAVSDDLVTWRELPVAIKPGSYGDAAFSGSAFADTNNTAGFQTGDKPALIAAWTSTGRGECIAYSNDRGRTFTEYEGNPVVAHVGRDPKVIWYAPGGHWVMVAYDEDGEDRRLAFYSSDDLKTWTQNSEIPNFFECPELFELPVDGDASNTRWVVYGGDANYLIGQFDGKTFTPEHEEKKQFHVGRNFYASQTYSDIPESDGRRVQIGWSTTVIKGTAFNQFMCVATVLTLRSTDDGLRLFVEPVEELEALRTNTESCADVALGSDNVLAGMAGDTLDIEACIVPGDASTITFTIHGTDVVYDAAAGTLTCEDKSAAMPLVDGELRIRMLVDRASIEIFAADGAFYMPMGMVLANAKQGLSLTAAGGAATIKCMNVHQLKSIWK